MDPSTVQWLQVLAPVVVAGAAAWGGTRQALNGTRERVRAIDSKLDKHIEDDQEVQIKMVEGLAKVDTKLDSFIQHKG